MKKFGRFHIIAAFGKKYSMDLMQDGFLVRFCNNEYISKAVKNHVFGVRVGAYSAPGCKKCRTYSCYNKECLNILGQGCVLQFFWSDVWPEHESTIHVRVLVCTPPLHDAEQGDQGSQGPKLSSSPRKIRGGAFK